MKYQGDSPLKKSWKNSKRESQLKSKKSKNFCHDLVRHSQFFVYHKNNENSLIPKRTKSLLFLKTGFQIILLAERITFNRRENQEK